MALHWQSAVRLLLPVVCLGCALGFRASGGSTEGWSLPLTILVSALVIGLVVATVFVVLHHAEALASVVGEPFGTLILTLSVTIIEASVIVSMMLHGENNPALARESVFSTVMIVTTGIVGVCLTLGGLRHRSQDLRRQGTSAFLAVLMALSVLTLILPNYTLSTSPGTFSSLQLEFVCILSILLYGAFLFSQTVRHQDDFREEFQREAAQNGHGSHQKSTVVSALLLATGLAGIVLLAEQLAAATEDGLAAVGVTHIDAIIGACIATLVLLPEALSAIRAALGNELQRSLNVALGSACATIGLTIPAVAVASLFSGRELTLGLEAGDTVILILALSISVVSFSTGRTTVLTGLVHVVVFVAYLMLIAVP
ncbi:ionic transporter [Mesorhizobium sp. CN2-181]|uniref:calcium:proton antiporter n=1 Tax=Mesorhizobium yinganensis TaxID=3157707 RepID=UPI0032B70E61